MSYKRLITKQKSNLGFGTIQLSHDQVKAEEKDKKFFEEHPHKYWYVRHVYKKELYNLPFSKSKYLMVFSIRPSEDKAREIFRIPLVDRDATPASLGLPVQRDNLLLDEQQLYLILLTSEKYIWNRGLPKWQKRIQELIKIDKAQRKAMQLNKQIEEALFYGEEFETAGSNSDRESSGVCRPISDYSQAEPERELATSTAY